MSESEKKTILIVEDDPSFRDFLGLMMTTEGYLPVYAGSGKEALALADGPHPAAIITDMMMPDVGGYEFLKQAQADFPGVPVIVLTAKKFDPVMQRDIENEMNVTALLYKPLAMPKMVNALNKAIPKEIG